MFAISEGPVSRNTQKLFGAVKPLVCSCESKHGGVYTLETSVEGNLCLYLRYVNKKISVIIGFKILF